jgi:lysophospholipase L1-like esterase
VSVVVTGLLALALAWPGAAAPAAGQVRAAPRVTRGSWYLALGDSVTFGYQEPFVVPTPDYPRAASFRGYPEHLGTELHLRVANAACPGETSASLISGRPPSLGCEAAYRRLFVLHVRYRGSQLGYAVRFLRRHRHVRLVSLMIGANDLFLCQTTTTDHCASPAEHAATLARVSRNVGRILSAIRHRARYCGQLVVVNYYTIDYTTSSLAAPIAALNRTVDRAARPFWAKVANGFGEFRTASRRFANQPCLAGLLTRDQLTGTCGVHPSYAGQALLAKAVATATRL